MKTAATFANRLALLRNEKGLTQEELAIAISELENRVKCYSNLSVSGWEAGDKCPPLSTFIYLCDFFDVSADYLCGRSDNPHNDRVATTTPPNFEGPNKAPDYHVTFNNLEKFDGEPIYVVFNDKKSSDKWGVLDYTNKRIAFTNSYLRISRNVNCTYYANIPESQKVPKYNLKKKLSMTQLLAADKVWIEMISADDKIKGQYNGWFWNNETRTNLINAVGLTLPYEGLSISYNAFSEKF